MLSRLYRAFIPFSVENDVINAEQDDALREHSKVVEGFRGATERRRQGNQTLRRSLQEARVNVFADFEEMMHSDRKRKGKPNGNGN